MPWTPTTLVGTSWHCIISAGIHHLFSLYMYIYCIYNYRGCIFRDFGRIGWDHSTTSECSRGNSTKSRASASGVYTDDYFVEDIFVAGRVLRYDFCAENLAVRKNEGMSFFFVCFLAVLYSAFRNNFKKVYIKILPSPLRKGPADVCNLAKRSLNMKTCLSLLRDSTAETRLPFKPRETWGSLSSKQGDNQQ